LPDRMPEDLPDRMPDRMPEDMSDRMPEDLPVTKRINVMVGMTRSKVIIVIMDLLITQFIEYSNIEYVIPFVNLKTSYIQLIDGHNCKTSIYTGHSIATFDYGGYIVDCCQEVLWRSCSGADMAELYEGQNVHIKL